MVELSNSTLDASTAAVSSRTAAASRSASVSAGAASTQVISTPASPRRRSWRSIEWNSPVVVTRCGRARRSSADRKRATSSWVLDANASSPGRAPIRAAM